MRGRRNILWLPLAGNDLQDQKRMSKRPTERREEPLHHIRHHGKHHKQPNLSDTTPWSPTGRRYENITTTTPVVTTVRLEMNNVSNGTDSPSSNSTGFQPSSTNVDDDNETSGENTTRSQAPMCYTTNEVLLIIGLTCILNFAFIVLVLSCVHFCSSAQSYKVSDIPRLESLLLSDSEFDSKRTSSTSVGDSLSGVQDYLDGLPVVFRPSTESLVPLQTLRPSYGGKGLKKPLNFLQETSCHPTCDTHVIPPSLSMENLLFTD